MGVLADYVERRLADELDRRGIVVWYDEPEDWRPFVERQLGCGQMPSEVAVCDVQVARREAKLIVFAGSYYEVLATCEPLTGGAEVPKLLIYLAGEPHIAELSPLRELECIGGEREPFQRSLKQMARAAFHGAGLADSKIDELIERTGVGFDFLDAVPISSEALASPLSPIFGSSREVDVVPAFLVDTGRRADALAKGLLPEVTELVQKGLGLGMKASSDADETARELVRTLLVAEMRSDLSGPEPVALSRIPRPNTQAQVARVREICARLRRDEPAAYTQLADGVEGELGLAEIDIDAEALGRIDTFRFEERCLLEACDRLLAEGKAERVLEIVKERAGSFWVSVSKHPDRHAAWQACGKLAQVSLGIDSTEKSLEATPANAGSWVEAYTATDGWHCVDQQYREARALLGRLYDPAELESGADKVLARYDALLQRMTEGFTEALRGVGWQVSGVPPQTDVYERHIAKRQGAVAYLLVDAMRFEMGRALATLLEAAGAQAMQLAPAIAAVPTITDLGMAALLPGAQRSFSIAESAKGVAGTIDGEALVGSAARMDYARGVVPNLIEMTLDRLLYDMPAKRLAKEVRRATVVLVRSQEIDSAGESLPGGVARRIMSTVLEDVRKAVLRLADAGVEHFVVTADHGHLFGSRRGDDMKIDPPEGGQVVDLHRRCWVGRGGQTPSSCVRLSAADLGYEGTDLDIVVPRGTGVFKAGGSLSFHHGGISLQELIIPVLSLELKGKRPPKARRSGELVALELVPREITNLIFSLSIRRTELALEPLQVRLVVEGMVREKGTTVGQAVFAVQGWNPDTKVLTLEAGEKGCEPVSVGIQVEDEEVKELRVLVVQVGTDRTLKDTSPIPVRVTR